MQPHHRGARRRDRRTRRPRPPAAADGGGWHLVVDGEQVGPISEADVRARVERGEINGETYIWKEGFADWLKLSAVPEFADLAPRRQRLGQHRRRVHRRRRAQPTNGSGGDSGGRRRSGANRPLFGDGGGERGRVRGARAAAAPAAGGDLFALGERALDRVERAALARPVGGGGARRWPATTAAASRT